MSDSVHIIDTMPQFIQEQWKQSGFKEPTNVQKEAIPSILEGKDLIVEAPTGSGKTLAYALPLIKQINLEQKHVQVVIIAPTRELVMQIAHVIGSFIEKSDIRLAALIGGADIKRQLEKLKEKPQIIIGTPQRIAEIIQMKKLKMHEVKSIVCDEIDQMLKNDDGQTIKRIISTTLRDRQLLFFSATISPAVKSFGEAEMQNLQLIQIKRNTLATEQVEHIYFVCEKRDKPDMLRRLLRKDNIKALVFVQNNTELDQLAERLDYLGFEFEVLYGEAYKTERERVMQSFRQGKVPVLVASDVAARGLDFKDITHVIHMDVPRAAEEYVHRSGRTGRMGATGTVIALVTFREEDDLLRHAKKIGIQLHKKNLYKGEIVDYRPKSGNSSHQKQKGNLRKK